MKAKFIPDKIMLRSLNQVAINSGFNQVIEPEAFDRIPDASYPITQSTLHNDDSIRCRIILNDKGDGVLLDIRTEIFNLLPEYDMAVNT